MRENEGIALAAAEVGAVCGLQLFDQPQEGLRLFRHQVEIEFFDLHRGAFDAEIIGTGHQTHARDAHREKVLSLAEVQHIMSLQRHAAGVLPVLLHSLDIQRVHVFVAGIHHLHVRLAGADVLPVLHEPFEAAEMLQRKVRHAFQVIALAVPEVAVILQPARGGLEAAGADILEHRQAEMPGREQEDVRSAGLFRRDVPEELQQRDAAVFLHGVRSVRMGVDDHTLALLLPFHDGVEGLGIGQLLLFGGQHEPRGPFLLRGGDQRFAVGRVEPDDRQPEIVLNKGHPLPFHGGVRNPLPHKDRRGGLQKLQRPFGKAAHHGGGDGTVIKRGHGGIRRIGGTHIEGKLGGELAEVLDLHDHDLALRLDGLVEPGEVEQRRRDALCRRFAGIGMNGGNVQRRFLTVLPDERERGARRLPAVKIKRVRVYGQSQRADLRFQIVDKGELPGGARELWADGDQPLHPLLQILFADHIRSP